MEDKFWFQMLLLSLAFVLGGFNYLRVIFEKKITILDSDDAEKIAEKNEKIIKQRSEKRFAVGLFSVFLTMTFLNTMVSYQKDKKTTLYKQQADESFSMVSEASGGVAIDNYIYLVDDDKPKLFRAKYDDNKESEYFGRYNPKVEPIDLYSKDPSPEELAAEDFDEDETPAAIKTSTETKPVNDDKNSESVVTGTIPKPKKIKSPILRKGQVNDFEAAARFGKFIYLVTSHSDSKSKGEKSNEGTARQRFLEVELIKKQTETGEKEIGVVRRWANLRVKLEDALFSGKQPAALRFRDIVEAYAKTDVETVMQIEGLAIDKAGTVYLGFRGPDCLDKGCALIARTTLDEIFKPEEGKPNKWQPVERTPYPTPARFTVLYVAIGGTPENRRGIVDMLYWEEKDQILLLTNSVEKYKLNTSSEILCWSGKQEEPPRPLSKSFYEQPDYIFAKPEVLLLPGILKDKGVIFLDGQNFGGGQRVFSRRENRLE